MANLLLNRSKLRNNSNGMRENKRILKKSDKIGQEPIKKVFKKKITQKIIAKCREKFKKKFQIGQKGNNWEKKTWKIVKKSKIVKSRSKLVEIIGKISRNNR